MRFKVSRNRPLEALNKKTLLQGVKAIRYNQRRGKRPTQGDRIYLKEYRIRQKLGEIRKTPRKNRTNIFRF